MDRVEEDAAGDDGNEDAGGHDGEHAMHARGQDQGAGGRDGVADAGAGGHEEHDVEEQSYYVEASLWSCGPTFYYEERLQADFENSLRTDVPFDLFEVWIDGKRVFSMKETRVNAGWIRSAQTCSDDSNGETRSTQTGSTQTGSTQTGSTQTCSTLTLSTQARSTQTGSTQTGSTQTCSNDFHREMGFAMVDFLADCFFTGGGTGFARFVDGTSAVKGAVAFRPWQAITSEQKNFHGLDAVMGGEAGYDYGTTISMSSSSMGRQLVVFGLATLMCGVGGVLRRFRE